VLGHVVITYFLTIRRIEKPVGRRCIAVKKPTDPGVTAGRGAAKKQATRVLRADGADTNMASMISASFERSQRQGLSKAAQLYEAISSLVAAGSVPDGAKLPGEREIGSATGLSLGTVQKALNALTRDGDLVRQHGRGTFVRSARNSLKELWHYRFRHPTRDRLLPVYASVESLGPVASLPVSNSILGEDRAGYVKISRLLNIDDQFNCWSEMYLRASRFGRLLDRPISDLEGVNLKQILSDEFNAPTLAISQTARVERPSADISKKLGLGSRVHCLVIRVLATSRHREPITFQKIVVPPVEYELELTAGLYDVAKALAA
jgi:GntR family transcriptional regulator